MIRPLHAWLTLSLLAMPAAAQLGELQLGVVAAYGTGRPYGPGAGIVAGVAPGRIAYVGVRWTYHAGGTRLVDSASATEVRTWAQAFTVDLGVQIPVGAVEVLPGISLGAMRFAQRTRQEPGGAIVTSRRATEFLAAPGVAVEAVAGRLAFIPQLQYVLAGNPEFPLRVQHHGLVASVRIVVTREIGRIRR